MLKGIRNIFFLLTITICFSYCVKKKDPPKPNYGNYTPAINLADYCYFKTGSYWVYQDSASLKLDSVYVQNAFVQTYEVKASDGKDYIGTFHHYYMKTIDGIGDEREYDIYDELSAAVAKCCGGRYFCEVHWNRPSTATQTGSYFGYYVHMFNNFTSGITGGHGICCSGSQGDECWSRGSSNSLMVLNKTFNNIVSFEILKIGGSINQEPNYHIKNYISRNFGIIKQVNLDSNITSRLIRYNIVQ